MFELDNDRSSPAVLKVIGVGGAGGNAVNRMISMGLRGVEFIAANTDLQALSSSSAAVRVQLGAQSTKGLGAGADPEKGRKAAEEDQQKIAQAVEGADMIFVTCGMGGGTGTGAAPVIAEVARKQGVLTVGVATKPFPFEGKARMRNAIAGILELSQHVDAVIVIPNEKLITICPKGTTIPQAFAMADDVLRGAVQGVSDIILRAGHINRDFADVRRVMATAGMCLMGTGTASGEGRAMKAVEAAIACPLLENVMISGAQRVLMNVTSGPDLTMHELAEAMSVVEQQAADDVEMLWGHVFDDSLDNEVRVTVIATGFLGVGPTGARADDAAAAAPARAGAAEPVPVFAGRAPAGRPNYDRASFRSPRPSATGAAQQVSREEAQSLGIAGEDYEIPAYLRRRG